MLMEDEWYDTFFSLDVYSCILFQRAARGSRIFSNMADILTEVMYVYSTVGLTCNWMIKE